MRVPLSWLKEYVDIVLPLDTLAERMTGAGLEVIKVETIGSEWARDRIFVGQVLAVRRHPEADRLLLANVAYGQDQPMEVVTGATNLRVGDAGQKVAFAIAGARLIDGHAEAPRYVTLKRSKIRGISSDGMVCSEKELGLSEDHAGILILPADAPLGVPLADYLGDVVLEIELTPNLARCLCVVGVAREVAALTGAALRLRAPIAREEGLPIAGQVEVSIADPDLCARYSAALINNVCIGPSPLWMQRRLILCGMRPINNIVDITNYVMLEWGQPLHAFDYHRLRARPGGTIPAIIVRRAHPGETMATLDGAEHIFDEQMLLITDGGGPVAVAGIMGGLESEVSPESQDILLEAANFDYISIRRTSAALRNPTEAAYRFGRGVDPELTVPALHRAAELMRTLAGGTVAQGVADCYASVPSTRAIDLSAGEVRRILGIDLSAERVAEMLRSLGFGCEVLSAEGQESALVRTTVPSFRLDVALPVDLLEEVARLYGYDQLPTTLLQEQLPAQRRNEALEAEEWVRDILVGCGLTEVISYSMTNLESVARLNPARSLPDADGYLKVTNPLTREREYLRQTLMNTTLEMVADNLRFRDHVALFEVARLYLPRAASALPDEPRALSIALAGPRDERSWLSGASEAMDFYDLKGIAETLFHHLGVAPGWAPAEHRTLHPGRAASITLEGKVIGVVGEVHPQVRANYDLPDQRVCLLELDLEALLARVVRVQKYRAFSRMPPVKEDLAVVVSEEIPSERLEELIRAAGAPLLVDVVLFDVYRGEQIGAGNKSLAYSLTFQAPEKTLTSDETAKLRECILQRLGDEVGARLRG